VGTEAPASQDPSRAFRFRLTFKATQPKALPVEEKEREFELGGKRFTLVARDSERLVDAMSFHVERGGYADEAQARADGERLRLRLRVLSAILGLGLRIPEQDGSTTQLSDETRQSILERLGQVAMDGIGGLAVFPDDGRHFEVEATGQGEVYAATADHVFDGLEKLWAADIQLNARASDALAILLRSSQEPANRLRFLLAFFALQRLIVRKSRSDEARRLLQAFEAEARRTLVAEEAESVAGSLKNLHEESIGAALRRFAKAVQSPPEFAELTLDRFLSRCVQIRNELAHDATIDDAELRKFADELRRLVVMIIWTECKLPDFSVSRPPSKVVIPPGGLKIRVH
jgi:hypothetical protein